MTTDTASLLDDLRRLDTRAAVDGNKHQRVIALIMACITSGVQTPKAIIETLGQLDFNRRHIGLMLQEGLGSNPQRHHWWSDVHGQLHLHE